MRTINALLAEILPEQGYFVSVGANDGHRGDLLWEFINTHSGWRGTLIEPMPDAFDRLIANYSDEARFKCANVAVSGHSGKATIYFLDKSSAATLGLPWWWDQLASFDDGHFSRHFGPTIVPHIRSAAVECDTLDNIVRAHWTGEVDLIAIDAEGADFSIMASPEFEHFRPRVIVFEHKHMSSREQQITAKFLTKRGYSSIRLTGDTLAWLTRDVEENIHGLGSARG
jgi:FkbM family methyltransferase